MLIHPFPYLLQASNDTRFHARRSAHLTWICLLHLGFIYLLYMSRQAHAPFVQVGNLKASLQWVFVRAPSSARGGFPSSQPQRVEQSKSLTTIAAPLTSNSPVRYQEGAQKIDQVANLKALNANDDRADPFVLPADISRLNYVQQRYHLQVPKDQEPEVLTPAQQAAKDVRTNSPKLSKSELFAQAVGTLECIYQTRLANGKIVREPGRWVVVPARSEPGQPKNIFKARFCVRLHQNDDVDGNDLTEISAGLRGK